MRILITGATGFIGSKLVSNLKSLNHQIIVLTRNPSRAKELLGEDVIAVEWNHFTQILDLSEYGPIDGVVNLVGENIAAKRWSDEQKQKIYDSRIVATQSIFQMLEQSKIRPKVFVSTSAIGFYGHRDGNIKIDENSLPGSDFLSQLCVSWEKAVTSNKDKVDRLAILRVGLVVGKNAGAVHKMLPIFKLGLGGKLGSGKQFMSWIHIEDLVRMYVTLLEQESLSGVFNGVSNYAVSNEDFTNTLAKVLRKGKGPKVPAFMLELVLGEMSTMLLKGANVIPEKFNQVRFHYMFPTIELALKDVVSKV